MAKQPVLRVKQVAVLLGLSLRHTYDVVRTEVPHRQRRQGAGIDVDRAEFEKWYRGKFGTTPDWKKLQETDR